MKLTRGPLRTIKNTDALRMMLSFDADTTRCDGDILEDWKLSSLLDCPRATPAVSRFCRGRVFLAVSFSHVSQSARLSSAASS